MTETKDVYGDLLSQIYDKDFILNAVALDGKAGIINIKGYILPIEV